MMPRSWGEVGVLQEEGEGEGQRRWRWRVEVEEEGEEEGEGRRPWWPCRFIWQVVCCGRCWHLCGTSREVEEGREGEGGREGCRTRSGPRKFLLSPTRSNISVRLTREEEEEGEALVLVLVFFRCPSKKPRAWP